jgi:hypothetical protein
MTTNDRGVPESTPLQRLISDIEREQPGRKLFWRSLLADLGRKRAKFPIPVRARHRGGAASRNSADPVPAATISSRQTVEARSGPRFGRLLLMIIGLVGALFASAHVPKR